MIPLSIAPDLMEEAVLLAERQAKPGVARAFRHERDWIYELADPELREAEFQALALKWFERFGFPAGIRAAIADCHELEGRVAGGRIVRAGARAMEGADLVDAPAAREHTESRPLLVLRLMPQSLMDGDALSSLLRHELMHVTDMLDPAFGYQRTLPPADDGPSADNILRDRYRVVWDVTIDGRLAQAGCGQPQTRDTRSREFRTAFAMLADGCPDAFERWWNQSHPTHAQLVAFATAPAGAAAGPGAGRCPSCQFPVASLDARVSTVAEPVVRALRAEHPSWRPEHGICSQCFDLYEARYGHPDAVHC
jgi:hypothetical protein